MSRTPDAVVMGAGIIGASHAFRLAERDLSVVILEQDVFVTGKIMAGWQTHERHGFDASGLGYGTSVSKENLGQRI